MTKELININGWKGKGQIEIHENVDFYIIHEHRKAKETGEVKTNEHRIFKGDVRLLWNIICQCCDIGDIYTSKYLARKLIQHHNLTEVEGLTEEQLMNALWGGKYRAMFYFPLLYYPLKILEAKQLISYGGRGNFTRLHREYKL